MTIKLENNFNNESFCPEVYNQLQIDMQGELRICCLTSDAGLLYDSDGKAMNVKTHSITDALNSNEHKQHRLELSNNIKPTRCSNCYNWEKHGSSRRNKFIQYSKNSKLPDYVKAEEAYSITSADGSIDTSTTKLLNLDIRFGNLCNLKCIMCDPGNSSLWYDDWELLSKTFNEYSASGKSVQFNNGGIDPVTGKVQYWKGSDKVYLIEPNQHGKLKMQGEVNWWESESWKTQFKTIAPQLQFIYFTGGEPLLVPAMEEHLSYLIEQGFSQNIRLTYDTNLTVINQNIIDKWKFFKFVELRISVDDIGDRYNVVRNPGNFAKLAENIKVIQEAGIGIQQIGMVCSIANIYGSIRLAQFCKKLGVKVSIRFVNRPNWLSLVHLPTTAKEEAIKVLTDFLSSHESDTVQEYEYIIHQTIKHLTDILNKPYRVDMVSTFIRAMNTLDSSRNLDWKKTLPDVASLLERHCPELDINMK